MNLTNSELKFIKTYHKKNYDKEQNIVADEFDIKERQAPLKTFHKVNREKSKDYRYKFFAHKRKIYSSLPLDLAQRLEETVIEINDYEENKAIA